MTSKERGNWLINKFYNLHAWDVMDADKRRIEYDIAKEAAIICVEQIIDAFSEFTVAADAIETGADGELEIISVDNNSPVEYWKEVLGALNKSQNK